MAVLGAICFAAVLLLMVLAFAFLRDAWRLYWAKEAVRHVFAAAHLCNRLELTEKEVHAALSGRVDPRYVTWAIEALVRDEILTDNVRAERKMFTEETDLPLRFRFAARGLA